MTIPLIKTSPTYWELNTVGSQSGGEGRLFRIKVQLTKPICHDAAIISRREAIQVSKLVSIKPIFAFAYLKVQQKRERTAFEMPNTHQHAKKKLKKIYRKQKKNGREEELWTKRSHRRAAYFNSSLFVSRESTTTTTICSKKICI